VFIGHCHGHIRNFIIKGMMNAATEKLKLLLEDDLSEFSSFERMSVNAMDLILAAYKEFHPGGAYGYAKGNRVRVGVLCRGTHFFGDTKCKNKTSRT